MDTAALDLGAVGLSSIGGAVTGVLGSIIGRGFQIWEMREKRKDRVLDYEQERAKWGHEKELAAMQHTMHLEEIEAESAAQSELKSWDGLTASIDAASKVGESYRWVSAVQALTRPVLTVGLIACATGVGLAAGGDTLNRSAATLAFLATSAVLWWFGDRAARQRNRTPWQA